MDEVNEVTQIIEEEEVQEAGDLHEIESGDQLNVIPLQLIKVSNRSAQPSQFATVVKGKYSKYYKQTYRPAWEQMSDFKGWLRGVKGEPTRAYCTYCQKTLHAHRLSLLKHTCTIRHQKAAQLHGNASSQKNAFNVNMCDNNMQTVIVNEESIVAEDGELMQSQVIYTTGEEEVGENDQDTENEQDEEEDDDEYYEETITTVVQDNAAAKNIISPVSTHVLDMTRGAPVAGLSVSLYRLVDGRWTYINEGVTDTFGRFSDFIKAGHFSLGRYKLHYDVDRYFDSKKQESMFPFVETVFDVSSVTRYHFPLLLSPNSYTTYRSTTDD